MQNKTENNAITTTGFKNGHILKKHIWHEWSAVGHLFVSYNKWARNSKGKSLTEMRLRKIMLASWTPFSKSREMAWTAEFPAKKQATKNYSWKIK